jgi:uncharacterized cupredoxin-like copper-binding protein
LSKFGKGSLFVLGAVAALTLAVTGAFAGPAKQAATTNIAVTTGKPSAFKFTLSKRTVNKGTLVFKVTNKGMLTHDFKIAGKKTKHLKKGQTATLRVTIAKAGKYKYICTLPSHAAAGMKGVLTVK